MTIDTPLHEETNREIRTLKVALLKTLDAISYEAGQGDGYSASSLEALRYACPLVGITLTEHLDPHSYFEDKVYRLTRHPAFVLPAMGEEVRWNY